tara:strand:- start:18568 stop:19281 length:714 start_codon:yes stop_codon:yes gene_type:complete
VDPKDKALISKEPGNEPVTDLTCTVVTDGEENWFVPYAQDLVQQLGHMADVSLVFTHDEVESCDIVFYLSYYSIVPEEVLSLARNNIVVHESDLPRGRGWSPLTWQVLEGRNQITISLFEANPLVDTGVVYVKECLELEGTELIDEIRAQAGQIKVSMCRQFVENYPEIIQSGIPQTGDSTYYPRRTLSDSRLDPEDTISRQFNLLRVVDNKRYPAFFEFLGRRYLLRIEAADTQDP